MSKEDLELILKATRNDRDAIGKLLMRFGPIVESKIQGQIAHHHQGAFDIADVMQVTYLETFLRIPGLELSGVDAFQSWLMKVTENNLRDAVRGLERAKRPPRKRQVLALTNGDSYFTLLATLGTLSGTPSRIVAKDDSKRCLETAISRLPRDYEHVVREVDLLGKAVSDVSDSMDRSNGAIHMLRARAHERLAEILGPASDFLTNSA